MAFYEFQSLTRYNPSPKSATFYKFQSISFYFSQTSYINSDILTKVKENDNENEMTLTKDAW